MYRRTIQIRNRDPVYAKAITDTLERVGGIKSEATTVMFGEIPSNEWFVAGKPIEARQLSAALPPKP
ncbi:tautomerase family protein [Sinorhizobium fredii]|uniref:tautomerase family protein n=1 Tax=Rhizobium fredii TaxID=380 RepID=UPI001297AEDF|nr:tautomerase family protein [Sinorhizobium fredii]MQW96967.1 hypothetical protein [Sinorhizobium fredii]UTY45519.1 hypothetical protein EPK84_00635 [Sinorhizobium fredii]